jgi:hypothetical protein
LIFKLSTPQQHNTDLSVRLGVGSGNLSWASEGLLSSTLGVQAGCVTPLAAANAAGRRELLVLLDARLRGGGKFFVHPIVNSVSVRMDCEGLETFLRCAVWESPSVAPLAVAQLVSAVSPRSPPNPHTTKPNRQLQQTVMQGRRP